MGNGTTVIVKSMLDPKRRNELIDEAFLEQKDMLLDMLEAKLKEVRDKKVKQDHGEIVIETNNNESKCEFVPKEVDVVMKAHGISAIGDTDVQLKYGENGNGSLRLDATGISNVGKVHVELGVGGGNVHIPGLDKIFTGETLLKKVCHQNKITEADNSTLNKTNSDQLDLDDQQTRRVNRGEVKANPVLTVSTLSNDFNNNSTFNYKDKSTSSTLNDNITVVPEETEQIAETVNDTNALTSTDDNK